MTEPKQTEVELLRSRVELAETQRLAQLGSWEWEIGPDAVHWSDEMFRIYGIPPQQSPHSYQAFLSHVHPDDRALAQEVVGRALRDGTSFEFDHRIVRPDGAVRFVHARGRVVLDDDGKPVRMLGTGQDITERKEAERRAQALLLEQAARELAEATAARFRFLADAGSILASALDVEATLQAVARLAVSRIADWCAVSLTDGSGEVVRVEIAHADPARERFAKKLLERYPPEPLRSSRFAEEFQRGDPILVSDVPDSLLVELARDDAHLELLRRGGFRSVMAVPLRARERLIGAITLATAESGRRFGPDDLSLATSLAVRASLAIDNARLLEDARNAARAREEAVATVAHDLRNPLSVVESDAQILRQAGLPEAQRRRALDRIQRSVGVMTDLISNYLDVTKLDARAVELEIRPERLESLLAEACELIEPAAAARSLQVLRRAAPELVCRADRSRILQVVGNLLENAVRHSPSGGSVRVEAAAAGGRALVSVEDQGPGVPQEIRDRIFGRFWQADGHRRIGWGLGLAIARRVVDLHGGQIWVESPAEGGARFVFTLELDQRRER